MYLLNVSIKYFQQSLIIERSLNIFKAGLFHNLSHLQMHPIFIYSNKLNYMLFTKNSQTSLWLHVVYCLINILPSAMSTIFFIPTIFLTPTLNVIYLQKPFPFPDRNILFLFLPQTLIHVSNILLSILPHKYVCIYLSSVLT